MVYLPPPFAATYAVKPFTASRMLSALMIDVVATFAPFGSLPMMTLACASPIRVQLVPMYDRRLLAGRSPSSTTVGTPMSMHLFTASVSDGSQPPTTDTPAGFCAQTCSTAAMKPGMSKSVGPATRTCTCSSSAIFFMPT